MTINAKLEERAARRNLDRQATLRGQEPRPVDVVVENLSESGCLIAAAPGISVGSLISLGIPGIGMHVALVKRVARDTFGCAFVTPISAEQVEIANAAEPVVEGAFPRLREPDRAPNRMVARIEQPDRDPVAKPHTLGKRIAEALSFLSHAPKR